MAQGWLGLSRMRRSNTGFKRTRCARRLTRTLGRARIPIVSDTLSLRIAWDRHPILTGTVSSLIAAGVLYLLSFVPLVRGPLRAAASGIWSLLTMPFEVPVGLLLLAVIASPVISALISSLQRRLQISKEDAAILRCLASTSSADVSFICPRVKMNYHRVLFHLARLEKREFIAGSEVTEKYSLATKGRAYLASRKII
jgi:hypothetical protein